MPALMTMTVLPLKHAAQIINASNLRIIAPGTPNVRLVWFAGIINVAGKNAGATDFVIRGRSVVEGSVLSIAG